MPLDLEISAEQYEALAEFRSQIRQFLRFAQNAARTVGLKPRQQQLLLILKSLPGGTEASITDVAERLLVPHHTAVKLIAGLRSRGLVDQHRSAADRRKVVATITPLGELLLQQVSLLNLGKLRAMTPTLLELLTKMAEPPSAREASKARPTKFLGEPEPPPRHLQGGGTQPQRVGDD